MAYDRRVLFAVARVCLLPLLAALLACGANPGEKAPEVLTADVSTPSAVASAPVILGRPILAPTADMHAIWGADARHMFAVGDNGTVAFAAT